MKLKLERKFKGTEYTIGDLFIDGVFFSNILEDTVRGLTDKNNDGDFDDKGEGKVYGETAIPAGTYNIIITYSTRFKKYLPLLLDVPGYEGIRIHPGNTAVDTHGCLLPGINNMVGQVTKSRETTQLLIDKISNSLNIKKEKVTITIE